VKRLTLSVFLTIAVLAPPLVRVSPAGARATGSLHAKIAYLFASDADGDGEVYAVDSDGALTNLTENELPDWDPVLSPAGTGYAFVSRRDGNSEIYVSAFGFTEGVNLTRNPSADYEPDWSPDGRRLVFVSERDGGRDLYLLSVADGAVERLTQAGVGELYRSPAWSPSGEEIAYSAVRAGAEQVYVKELSGQERQITRWPLKGRFPAWSPDGRWLAFAGWHEDDRPGIYLASADGSEVRWLWEARSSISNLAWLGGRIAFTLVDGAHDIYTLDLQSAIVTKLVSGPAWEDGFSARQGKAWPAVVMEDAATFAAEPAVAFGANIADLSDVGLVRDLGFGWIKNYLSWAGVEARRGSPNWVDPDNVVRAAQRSGLKVLMRIHDTPDWARPRDTTITHPPSDLGAYFAFVASVAWRYRGRVAAYEIGNEPNLAWEWGNETPDPAGYAITLRLAYMAIKAIDPAALVVSGGLATTGDGGPGAMGDLDYLRGLYRAGARGYFDALGAHPYGYGSAPFAQHPYGLAVTRLEQQRAVMLEFGDERTPIWATETGWPLPSAWSMGEHDKYVVSEAAQADYYVQLYTQAPARWPWLQGIFLFNLDFSTVPWYDARQPMRWYAILEGDGSPRLAYTRLRDRAVQGAPR